MLGYLKTLTFILFMLSLGFTWRYEYWLLYHLSFGALVVLALFIGFTFVVGFYLKDSTNAALNAIGKVYETLFQYTALAQGVFYTTLVFYVVGTTVNGDMPLPDFDRQFMFDWMYGSGFATLLVYVSLLAMLLFFQKLSPQGYLLAAFIAAVGAALPIYFFAAENQVRSLHANYGGFFTYSFIFSHLALSAAGMYSMVLIGKQKKQKR
ncbi:hypothetical protein [Turneriella parva]|uniref:Uncharacterized protein n=1 Tax=Turneriella parva (strain ATCC BAA-1111 / DSM 21527 / NCTC 11395 / H) TaxID=869212 RepID=I4B5G7_TURPD|nr:hypothetical protein [Turneriella parva]AFM12524.1 hypothetical protein Turpa_1877 [Turneriella parva DSM 21527]